MVMKPTEGSYISEGSYIRPPLPSHLLQPLDWSHPRLLVVSLAHPSSHAITIEPHGNDLLMRDMEVHQVVGSWSQVAVGGW